MIKWQTKIKVPYKILNPEQKKDICNGCGGKGGIVKPPKKAFYKTSCNKHDYGYACGGDEKERKRHDKGLKKAMKEDCSTLPWYQKPRYKPWCYLYYRGVRAIGWKFFYWGKTRWPEPTLAQLEQIKAL